MTPKKHQEGIELQVGEMGIMMDYADDKDWYVAEVAQVLSDRFTVNGFTTTGAPLAGYKAASRKDRVRALHGISFHRTWCKDKGKGKGTIIPPAHLRKGEAPMELEDPHRRGESAAAHQECHLGEGWMPVQDHQGVGGSLKVPSSCWSGRC